MMTPRTKAPSLASLCIKSLKLQLLQSDNPPIPDLYELPSELLEGVVAHLPALALHNFQTHMPFNCCLDSYESGDDCLINNGRKRARNDVLGNSWKVLFELRWPEFIDHVESPADWQHLYWEKHLQNCVDEAAEVALRPTFSGRICSINVSDNILRYICHDDHMTCPKCVCKELSFHFRTFGPYLRCLRLLNVLCVTEISELLRKSKLQRLVLRWIRSEKHVEPLCKLLIQSRDTLTSLEFIHCKLSSNSINAICASLHEKGIHTTGMQRFSIKTSSIEIDPLAAPSSFIAFLMSVRTLHSLHFCDGNLDRHIARMVFSTLLDSSSNLSSLDLSENNISGWLSTFSWRSVVGSPSSGKSLRSLCKLNLRGNELDKYDAENLAYALLHMPGLESLDLSGNPIEDSGIRSLISYFTKNPNSRLADLDLENCELSCCGVIEFLDTLSMLEKPIKFLSVADNALGSEVAEAIVNSFTVSIESLNISGIGLGPLGFLALGRKLEKGSKKLLSINISKNRGGQETARFLSKLIPLAPRLISVDASYNLMPPESLLMLCDSLRTAKGDLKRLDMTGNSCINHKADHSTLLSEFQHSGEPIFVLPSSLASHVPYDDDP
ncbi:PREDICTED: NACHT, LRR and PYD domains-containing protein 5-like isoform X1 [Camelina sativa]|uniref:NACHT, LRR and PYD domains-containing protein 5-like isoform X1 n=1 Tax=Camelina sativa TaxID=90675 RepID=A0ABM0Y5M2_CAMSA|nr:PREDICTED: NACHT, LRR and PYD domains-containing protein 5-like isoform X1 [Camelina sativa]